MADSSVSKKVSTPGKPQPSVGRGAGSAPARAAKSTTAKRQSTPDYVKLLVWIRAGGHCELCGRDLTQDPRLRGAFSRWGEVAHLLPASPGGPRAPADYTEADAKAHTASADNLLLACPNCHTLIDKDPELNPEALLTARHRAHVQRIRWAASHADGQQAVGLVFLSQHFDTANNISERELVPAMMADGLVPLLTERVVLPPPKSTGRDAAYWEQCRDVIDTALIGARRRGASREGDPPILAVAGLADMPALMTLGLRLGDRSDRRLFSYSRLTGLQWPAPTDPPPDYTFAPPPPGKGPIALVLSLSATIPTSDVLAALPDARVAVLTVTEPNVNLVRNRNTIDAFRAYLQPRLSELEAASQQPLHVFPALPAALAIEYGALLSVHHRHGHVIYDRGAGNRFVPTLTLT